jgi:hypothetical protein
VDAKDGNDVQTYARLDVLTQMMLQSDPRLAQAALAVQVAARHTVQAGLLLNPVAGFFSGRTIRPNGPGGILTPSITQEIVTGNKPVSLNRLPNANDRRRN